MVRVLWYLCSVLFFAVIPLTIVNAEATIQVVEPKVVQWTKETIVESEGEIKIFPDYSIDALEDIYYLYKNDETQKVTVKNNEKEIFYPDNWGNVKHFKTTPTYFSYVEMKPDGRKVLTVKNIAGQEVPLPANVISVFASQETHWDHSVRKMVSTGPVYFVCTINEAGDKKKKLLIDSFGKIVIPKGEYFGLSYLDVEEKERGLYTAYTTQNKVSLYNKDGKKIFGPASIINKVKGQTDLWEIDEGTQTYFMNLKTNEKSKSWGRIGWVEDSLFIGYQNSPQKLYRNYMSPMEILEIKNNQVNNITPKGKEFSFGIMVAKKEDEKIRKQFLLLEKGEQYPSFYNYMKDGTWSEPIETRIGLPIDHEVYMNMGWQSEKNLYYVSVQTAKMGSSKEERGYYDSQQDKMIVPAFLSARNGEKFIRTELKAKEISTKPIEVLNRNGEVFRKITPESKGFLIFTSHLCDEQLYFYDDKNDWMIYNFETDKSYKMTGIKEVQPNVFGNLALSILKDDSYGLVLYEEKENFVLPKYFKNPQIVYGDARKKFVLIKDQIDGKNKIIKLSWD